MKVAELSRRTGINKHALGKFYNEKAKSITFDHMNKICKSLGCEIGELIEYKQS